MSTLVASAAAMGSAFSYAVAGVAQHRAARQAPTGSGLHLGLVAHLATRPLWLVGLLADGAALVLHIVALSGGELALVQPLLVSGLLFALPVSVLLERRRPSFTEWCWALVLVVALAAFLAVGQPSAGRIPSDTDRLGVLSAGAVLAAALVVLAGRVFKRQRAALFGLAAGMAFGLTAGLLKESSNIVTGAHPLDLLSSWPFYALVAVGGAAMVLNQAAFQAGPLAASLPPLTMADPIVAIVLGLLVFDETLAHDPVAVSIQILTFVLMSLSVIKLARRSSEEPERQDIPSL